MYQKMTIVGRLGENPVVKKLPSGQDVCNFSVAVNGFKKDDVTWFRVAVFDKLAVNCGQFLHKGSTCLVEGTIRMTLFKSKTGQDGASLDLTGNLVKFLSPPASGQPGPKNEHSPNSMISDNSAFGGSDFDNPASGKSRIGDGDMFDANEVPF